MVWVCLGARAGPWHSARATRNLGGPALEALALVPGPLLGPLHEEAKAHAEGQRLLGRREDERKLPLHELEDDDLLRQLPHLLRHRRRAVGGAPPVAILDHAVHLGHAPHRELDDAPAALVHLQDHQVLHQLQVCLVGLVVRDDLVHVEAPLQPDGVLHVQIEQFPLPLRHGGFGGARRGQGDIVHPGQLEGAQQPVAGRGPGVVVRALAGERGVRVEAHGQHLRVEGQLELPVVVLLLGGTLQLELVGQVRRARCLPVRLLHPDPRLTVVPV
mmetsp:Transcript_25828/g.72962  ORF Transcript_25828/g.72962 Transcript_25828/m.72962 type:complete len:273 (-) Transcript_25828:215-1033(-)